MHSCNLHTYLADIGLWFCGSVQYFKSAIPCLSFRYKLFVANDTRDIYCKYMFSMDWHSDDIKILANIANRLARIQLEAKDDLARRRAARYGNAYKYRGSLLGLVLFIVAAVLLGLKHIALVIAIVTVAIFMYTVRALNEEEGLEDEVRKLVGLLSARLYRLRDVPEDEMHLRVSDAEMGVKVVKAKLSARFQRIVAAMDKDAQDYEEDLEKARTTVISLHKGIINVGINLARNRGVDNNTLDAIRKARNGTSEF